MKSAALVQPETTATDRPLMLATLGLVAGLGSGFLGIGGGLIIVPGLMLGFSYPIRRAVGVSLATVVLVSLVAVLVEVVVKGTNIHWTMALALAAGSLAGAPLGAWLLPRLPEGTLRALFAGCLLVASYRMLSDGQGTDNAALMTLGADSLLAYVVALPVGTAAGLTSALFGIGGGIVTVPCLSLLIRDLPFHAARATSLATIFPTSAIGAYQHHRLGHVDLVLVRRLIPATTLGGVAGVLLVNVLSPGPCRRVFAVFLSAVAVRILVPRRAASRESAIPSTSRRLAA